MDTPDKATPDKAGPAGGLTGSTENRSGDSLADWLDDPDALEALGRAAREKQGPEGVHEPNGTAPALSADLVRMLLGLPDLLAPLLKFTGNGSAVSPRPGNKADCSCSHRDALLLALKPYLNPARREMIDTLVQLGKLSVLLQGLQLPQIRNGLQILQGLRGGADEKGSARRGPTS